MTLCFGGNRTVCYEKVETEVETRSETEGAYTVQKVVSTPHFTFHLLQARRLPALSAEISRETDANLFKDCVIDKNRSIRPDRKGKRYTDRTPHFIRPATW